MPRHVINLAPDTYAFNDPSPMHENIWKAAAAIANAPLNLADLQMQQDDKARENEERGLRMEATRHGMKHADDTLQMQKDRYAAEDQTKREAAGLKATKAAEDATAKARAALEVKARDAGLPASETTGYGTLSDEELTSMIADHNANKAAGKAKADRVTETQKALERAGYPGVSEQDQGAMLRNIDAIKNQGLGEYALTMNQAIDNQPKAYGTGEDVPAAQRGQPIPEDARQKMAEDARARSYTPTLGEELGSSMVEGGEMGGKMVQRPGGRMVLDRTNMLKLPSVESYSVDPNSIGLDPRLSTPVPPKSDGLTMSETSAPPASAPTPVVDSARPPAKAQAASILQKIQNVPEDVQTATFQSIAANNRPVLVEILRMLNPNVDWTDTAVNHFLASNKAAPQSVAPSAPIVQNPMSGFYGPR